MAQLWSNYKFGVALATLFSEGQSLWLGCCGLSRKVLVIEGCINHDTVRAEPVEACWPFDRLRANGDCLPSFRSNSWGQSVFTACNCGLSRKGVSNIRQSVGDRACSLRVTAVCPTMSQISILLPSSTTELLGSLRKSAAPLALWCICANSFSRHCAMPLPMVGMTVSRDRK